MAIIGLKIAILALKTAMDLSKNIFSKKLYYIVWNHPFYDIVLYLPVSEMANGLKMVILGLKMAILDLKMALDIFENTFI